MISNEETFLSGFFTYGTILIAGLIKSKNLILNIL